MPTDNSNRETIKQFWWDIKLYTGIGDDTQLGNEAIIPEGVKQGVNGRELVNSVIWRINTQAFTEQGEWNLNTLDSQGWEIIAAIPTPFGGWPNLTELVGKKAIEFYKERYGILFIFRKRK